MSAASGKPILIASELAVTDPENPGPRTVRETGRLCYWSASRAVTALEHLWRRARFLRDGAADHERVAARKRERLAAGRRRDPRGRRRARGRAGVRRRQLRERLDLAAPRRGHTALVAAPRPQPLVDAVGAQRLQAVLDTDIGGDGTCFLVDGSGAQLAAHNPDMPLVGASTQKLLVAAAMLSTFGPDFTYETKVVAPAAPDNGSVDHLYFVGSGDPVIATDDYREFLKTQGETKGDVTTSLETLADNIVAAGVKHVPGGSSPTTPATTPSASSRAGRSPTTPSGDVGPLGALTVNDGLRAVDPAQDGGRATPPSTPRASSPACSPPAACRSVRRRSGHAPADATPIAKVSSPPLHSVIESMLTSSDNLSAELFTKELGVHASQQGTTAAGTAAIAAKLTELGVPHDGLNLVDGSGISHDDRVTCRILVDALALGDKPGMRALWDGLPVAGVNGTLYDELNNTPLAGKMRGKTGSLTGVSGLLGMVDLGRSVTFAFLDNGDFSETKAAGLRAQAATLIATYPDAPSADDLVPKPM